MEIAGSLGFTTSEVDTFVQGLVEKDLLNVASVTGSEKAYYTNPEKREEIYELIG